MLRFKRQSSIPSPDFKRVLRRIDFGLDLSKPYLSAGPRLGPLPARNVRTAGIFFYPVNEPPAPHRRRERYSGKNPRKFAHKYKEHDQNPETIAKVLASGKTPAGAHRPIMVAEVLEALAPKPGETAVDATLGFGGHARELLARLQPGGTLIGLDVDPIELPKTTARLVELGFGPTAFRARRSNFAGIAKAIAAEGLDAVDIILADLGVSSMQLDDPTRGFSMKLDGPLDMRMNPERGLPASSLLANITADELEAVLRENSDEPHARAISQAIAGGLFQTTSALAKALLHPLSRFRQEEREISIRRVFQALRIAVNEEFSALDMLLRSAPACLKPGGRIAILSFHSGEDRRVKKALQSGFRDHVYSAVAQEVIRPSLLERNQNPRSASAKLRWAKMSA